MHCMSHRTVLISEKVLHTRTFLSDYFPEMGSLAPTSALKRFTQPFWLQSFISMKFTHMGHTTWQHEWANEINRRKRLYAFCILLWCDEPSWLKIAWTTAIRRVHPKSIKPCWSNVGGRTTCWSSKQLCVTYEKISIDIFVKDNITMTIPNYPKRGRNTNSNMCLGIFCIPLNQLPNILDTLVGSKILKVKWTTLWKKRSQLKRNENMFNRFRQIT